MTGRGSTTIRLAVVQARSAAGQIEANLKHVEGLVEQRYTVTEPGPSDAVPVLRRYMTQIRITRPYFDAATDSPDDAITAELPRNPVFELTSVNPHRP
jgi:hypothetical protein